VRDLPGFNLPIEDSPDGPLLVVEGQLDWPLCKLVNAAVCGVVTELGERLRGGDGFRAGDLIVDRPPPALDLAEQTARFVAESGYDEADIAAAGGWVVMDGEPYPCAMIMDVYDALGAERVRWCRNRARDAKAKTAWERYRSQAERPIDPLFRIDAGDDAQPASGMADALRELEERAALVDTLETQLRAGANVELAATISAKRRFLLVELAYQGLLCPSAFEAKHRALDGCPTLRGYLTAARAFAEYMASPERKQFAGELPAYPPSGGATISLDWFRVPEPIPASVVVGAREWAGWVEREADDYFSRDHGGTGWWYWHSGSVSHTFYWRYDDAIHPCVYRVT
jgi:hypothetical protein